MLMSMFVGFWVFPAIFMVLVRVFSTWKSNPFDYFLYNCFRFERGFLGLHRCI
ncbi:hypothetical protein RchiOBHm_Chr3g0490471 [Rosa chinensis]|uniref:Uncharacterized protein n=1 Tax=Rosa chinensis TaxID=74649 RepID=A0A2P6RG26_ROSCH|nr:hypothetical protein RchiOBHm_Chr3g0490471 [Rosa chinensis]